jgi:hypothetical protein
MPSAGVEEKDILAADTLHKEDVVASHQHQKELALGAHETLQEGRSPWKVLLENKKALLLILAVQVTHSNNPTTPCALLTSQSNAIIVGVEFSLPGNLLGIPAFLKEASTFACRLLQLWSDRLCPSLEFLPAIPTPSRPVFLPCR